jgi:hypothetical protein
MLSPTGPKPSEITTCRKCHAEIMFLRTSKGSLMPVNVMPTSPKFRGPNSGEITFQQGQHQSHFATCTDDPASFRTRSPAVVALLALLLVALSGCASRPGIAIGGVAAAAVLVLSASSGDSDSGGVAFAPPRRAQPGFDVSHCQLGEACR